MEMCAEGLDEDGRFAGSAVPGKIAFACLMISMSWPFLIILHVATTFTQVLTPLSSDGFYEAMIIGGVVGLIPATVAAIAAWFLPWPRGRSIGVAASVWLMIAVIGSPADALMGPAVASRLMEWKAFGWRTPVWTRTLHKVSGYRSSTHKGIRSYELDIDPYGQPQTVPIDKTDFDTLAAADRPDRPWTYCIAIFEQRANGAARMMEDDGLPPDGGTRLVQCAESTR